MAFKELLPLSAVEANVSLSSKDDVLRRLATLLAQKVDGVGEEAIYRALLEREAVGSTGMVRGFALPHCSLENGERFAVAVVTTAEGIDFGALDKEPSRFFVAVAGPERERSIHVRLIASITKFARLDGAIERALTCGSAEELHAELVDHIHFEEEPERKGPFSLVRVGVEGRERLERALEVLSGEPDCSIQVAEARSAVTYLHRMPLFATFWSPEDRSEHFSIEAILPRRNVNAVIRRLEAQIPSGKGAIVSVVELSYSHGSLDL